MSLIKKMSLLLCLVSTLIVSNLALAVRAADPDTGSTPQTGGAPCMLGDGYVILSGSNLTVFPVSCGSDCHDYPDGGFATTLFCLNGALGESDPVLARGSVAPLVIASQYNGFSRCTALPNSYRRLAQSADRKSCVKY